MRALALIALTASILTGGSIRAAEAPIESRITFDIKSQSVRGALREFARQSGVQLLHRDEYVQLDGAMSPSITGSLAAREALEKLLSNTSFTYEFVNARTVRLTLRAKPTHTSFAGQSTPSYLVADTERGASATGSSLRDTAPAGASREKANRPDVAEVVVSAQRRNERLQDVPISVSVLSGTDLDRSTTRGMAEELSRIPGVSVLENFNGGKQISVRGVAVSTPLGGGASTTAYYLDSVPFGFVKSAYLPDAGAYDLDRVEVLRGPQGTLYGASALNGVVRILTKDADLQRFEFKGRGAASSIESGSESYRADIALNVPLIEGRLAARAVVSYQDLGGWIDKPLLSKENANSGTIKTGRLKLNAQATDQLSVGAFAWFSRDQRDNPSSSADGRVRPTAIAEPTSNDYDSYGLKLSYDAPGFVVSASTGYIDYELVSNFLSIIGIPAAQTFAAETFSQEITANSTGPGNWRWTIGGIYRDSKDLFETRAFAPVFRFPDSNRYLSESSAVFGELTRLLFDEKLELTAGLRYFEDKVRTRQQSLLGPVQPATLVSADDKFHSTKPRFVATWHPTDTLTTYASYGEGFRSGLAQPPTIITAGIPSAKPDTLKNYEMGAKGTFFNGRLVLDSAMYFNKWVDVQRTVLVRAPNGLNYNAFINGSSASGPGVDLAATLRPVPALTVGLTAAWNDLTMDKDVVSGGVTLFEKGSRLDNSPRTTLGASGELDFPVAALGMEGRLGASVNYVSEQELRSLAGSVVTVFRSDSILIARSSFSLTSPKGWTITAYVDNLTREDGIQAPMAPNDNFAVRVQPRTYGLQLDYRL